VGERALTRAGFEAAALSTAREARPPVERCRVDAAILDYYLAGDECGCDRIPMLRGQNPTVRVAVLSGLGVLPDLVRHALGAGADLVAFAPVIAWPDAVTEDLVDCCALLRLRRRLEAARGR
jgi:ActR/RegA family two-component response regulator